jgi:hypothetical protein
MLFWRRTAMVVVLSEVLTTAMATPLCVLVSICTSELHTFLRVIDDKGLLV